MSTPPADTYPETFRAGRQARRIRPHSDYAVSYKDRKKLAASMHQIYTAPNLEAAELAFKEFNQKYGEQYPGAVDTWQLAWNEFTPFLDYPVELRSLVTRRP